MKFTAIQKFIGSIGMTSRESNSPAAPTELFELSCVCAVTDRAYVLQYERTAGGKLRFLKSIKSDAPKNGAGAVARSASTIRMDAFEPRYFPCPWCNANSICSCGRCRSLVCNGRLYGRMFNCRASCGNSGVTTPMGSLTGETGKTGHPAALREPAGSALALRAGTDLARRQGKA
jgi:hypothetical protein